MNLKASPEHLNSPLIESEGWKGPSDQVASPLRVHVVTCSVTRRLRSAYFRITGVEIFHFEKIKERSTAISS